MATERIKRPQDEGDISPEQLARINRALADSAAGRVYDNLTTEALERFVALGDVEAQALLAEPDALRHWFSRHAV
ncbi:MAG TPA: hypothetical protein VFE42_33760 [Chloroflexota bacterium]|nr:hypothetical protein [Chloroflexota bacterium]